MHKIRIHLSFLFGLSLIAIMTFWVARPLLMQGFYPMHDDTQPSRVFEMTQALKDGMFPVRWSSDLGYGYGYPLFTFYAPFFYYSAAAVSLVGFDALVATKIMLIMGIFLSGVGMYLLGRAVWGEAAGLLSGVLYLLVPYHALNIYVRGDFAEFYASVFIPFLFLGLYQSLKNIQQGTPSNRWTVLAALSYAAIITAHNLTGLMVTPFIVLLAIFAIVTSNSSRRGILAIFVSVLGLGLLVSSYYWLPVFPEMRYTNVASQIGGKASVVLHYVCPMQLWDSPWGFGGSAPGCIDGMSFRLGKIHILLAIISAGTVIFLRRRIGKEYPLFQWTVVGLIVSVGLTLGYSQLLWQIPGMNFFQYPWRFLLLAAFFSSLLSGGVVASIRSVTSKHSPWLAWGASFVGIVAALVLYGKLFQPQTVTARTVASYTETEQLRFTISKISDEYLPRTIKKPQSAKDAMKPKLVLANKTAKVTSEMQKVQSFQATVSDTQQGKALFRQGYFPAWRLYIDGNLQQYQTRADGLVFSLPSGTHVVQFRYEETVVERIASLLSVSGIAIAFLAIISKRADITARFHHGEKKVIR